MFKNLVICAVVSASACGCSTTKPPRTAAADAPPCIHDTGSRIPVRPGECTSTPGRSYSDRDLERTGQATVGDARPLLDPSITVHH